MSLHYQTPNEIYELLLKVVSSERFLQKQGLGNEIPFFICPYKPVYHIEMVKRQNQLVKQLERNGVSVLNINLYDLCIGLLQEKNIWNRVVTKEPTLQKSALKELLGNVLDPASHLVPKIADLIKQKPEHHVMFLSGIGEIYPYIRSHTILNNLQSTAKQQPTVMFFPGEYKQSPETGASLNLFDRLRDDKYYRAFNILEYNI